MLIQTSSPRPILNVQEHPKHVVIHTLRKPGISTGTVLLNMNTDVEHGTRQTGEVEPYEVFPIEGEPGFEALEYYLPFDAIFGTGRQQYNETAIARRQNAGEATRVDLDDMRKGPRDTAMALFAASGISVIARSAFRAEGSVYEERIFNFQLFFPVTGGGIIRVAGSAFDVTNPTFNPKAVVPRKDGYANLTLREAFNRTHKTANPDIERRKRERIAQAEASMRSEGHELPPARRKLLLPGGSDE